MAQLRLQAPEPFNFKAPDDWQRWKRRFEQFRVASGLKEESDIKQVSMLLYCLGEEAEAVLESTDITSDDRKRYDKVIEKLDAFFKVRKNVVFERAQFNRRKQLEGEPAEQYIIALYKLADNCEYGAMKDELIRDRLVDGIRDKELSEQLQLIANLTLDGAKKKIREREAVQAQQKELKGAEATSAIGEVRAGRRHPVRGSSKKSKPRPQPRARQCTRCRGTQHPKERCPAKRCQMLPLSKEGAL